MSELDIFVGKTVVSVVEDEGAIMLVFEDGSQITASSDEGFCIDFYVPEKRKQN